MSFLFGRRPRTNTVDLPKQAKEQISKLDGPAGAAKVGALLPQQERKMLANRNIG
jgi:calcium binding protein 39